MMARPGKRAGRGGQLIMLALLAFLPKCPLCLAVYLGFLAAFGLDALAVAKWLMILVPMIGALLLLRILWLAIANRRTFSFWLALAGFVAFGVGRYGCDSAILRWTGLVVISAGCADALMRSRSHGHCAPVPHPQNQTGPRSFELESSP